VIHEARELAGQLVSADLPSGGTEEVLRNLQNYPFGGIALHQWDTGEAMELRSRMVALWQEFATAALPAPFVALTEEGGTVHRFPGVVRPPSAMSLGEANDLELTEAIGRLWGRHLMAQGINWNWAPVADVLSEAENQVIGTRSFSSDPERVARHAEAWIRGHQSEGIIATAKHFPGHGMTQLDSHVARPVSSLSESDLARHLEPFRTAIEGGVRAMMMSHVVYSEFDERPATLSPYWYGKLRAMGFAGLAVTDALSMCAISDVYTPSEAAVGAIAAGADVVDCGSWEIALSALDAIALACERDSAFRKRAENARHRVLAAKSSLLRPEMWPQIVSAEALAQGTWQSALRGSRIIRGDHQQFEADFASCEEVWVSSRRAVEVEERDTSKRSEAVMQIDISRDGWRNELLEIAERPGALLLFTENVWKYPEMIPELRRICLRRRVAHVAVLDAVDLDHLLESEIALAVYGNFEQARNVTYSLLYGQEATQSIRARSNV